MSSATRFNPEEAGVLFPTLFRSFPSYKESGELGHLPCCSWACLSLQSANGSQGSPCLAKACSLCSAPAPAPRPCYFDYFFKQTCLDPSSLDIPRAKSLSVILHIVSIFACAVPVISYLGPVLTCTGPSHWILIVCAAWHQHPPRQGLWGWQWAFQS